MAEDIGGAELVKALDKGIVEPLGARKLSDKEVITYVRMVPIGELLFGEQYCGEFIDKSSAIVRPYGVHEEVFSGQPYLVTGKRYADKLSELRRGECLQRGDIVTYAILDEAALSPEPPENIYRVEQCFDMPVEAYRWAVKLGKDGEFNFEGSGRTLVAIIEAHRKMHATETPELDKALSEAGMAAMSDPKLQKGFRKLYAEGLGD